MPQSYTTYTRVPIYGGVPQRTRAFAIPTRVLLGALREVRRPVEEDVEPGGEAVALLRELEVDNRYGAVEVVARAQVLARRVVEHDGPQGTVNAQSPSERASKERGWGNGKRR